MVQRCVNPSDPAYGYYGARGITVDPSWMEFSQFIEDMGRRGLDEKGRVLTIERIDNSKGYGPGNCKWATRIDQARNMSSNVKLTLNGDTKIVVEWAETLEVPAYILYERCSLGWPDEATLTLPWRDRKGVIHKPKPYCKDQAPVVP